MAILEITLPAGTVYKQSSAVMGGVNVTTSFSVSFTSGKYVVNCSKILPANGVLQLSVLIGTVSPVVGSVGSWRSVNVAFQPPPNIPVASDHTGTFSITVVEPSVTVTPDPSVVTVPVGQNAVHTFTVTNTGLASDSFMITRTGSGTLSKTSVGPLAAGATDTFTLTYTTPAEGDISNTVIVRSVADESISFIATAITHVLQYGVSLTPPSTSSTIKNGTSPPAFTFTITNTGHVSDTYTITKSSAGVLSKTTTTIAAGANDTFTLTYTLPSHGDHSDSVTVTSINDATKTATSTIALHVVNYGAQVGPKPSVLYVAEGRNATHTFTVTNIGERSDTYTISTSGAGVLSTTSLGPIAAGAAGTFTLTYTTPALGDILDTVTVTSQADATKTDTANATTHVVSYSVGLTPATSSLTILQGGTAIYTFTVTNQGGLADTYTISKTAGNGDLSKTTIGPLAAGASQTFTLTLASPSLGDQSSMVQAQSQTIPTVTASATANTRTVNPSVTITPKPSTQTILVGRNATHTFTVSNTGTYADTYTITHTGSGTLSTVSLGPIAAGASSTFMLTYTLPAAGFYTETVTVTSTVDPSETKAHDSALATTNIHRYGLTLTPDPSTRTIIVGGSATHTFTLTNTGNVADTFTIVKTGAGTLSDTSKTVAAGASTTFTLTYTTPAAGVYNASVTATSGGDITKTVTVATRTNVNLYAVSVTPALIERVAAVGDPASVYTFTVRNNGNVPDNFTITVTGSGALNKALTARILAGGTETFTLTQSTATEGILVGTVTVTSAGNAAVNSRSVGKTFAVALTHLKSQTNAAPGVYIVNATEASSILNVTTTGVLKVTMYKLPGNPRPETPLMGYTPLMFGVTAFNSTGTVTWNAKLAVAYTATQVASASLDVTSLKIFYWDGSNWQQAYNTQVDTVHSVVTAWIRVGDLLNRSWDYDFVLAGVYSPPPPPPPLPPTASDLVELPPAQAADKLQTLPPIQQASLLDEMNSSSAADILDELPPETAAVAIVLMNTTNAADAVSSMTTATAVSMIEEATATNNTVQMAAILNQVAENSTAVILVDLPTDTAAALIESMATQSLNDAAIRVEGAIKLRLEEVDPVKRDEMMAKVTATLEGVTVEKLVSLFIEIANLPHTPSVVADVLNGMESSKVVTVVQTWPTSAYKELGLVFSYLKTDILSTVYRALTTVKRMILYPYLSTQTIAVLPRLTTFDTTLTVSPTSVVLGGSVTVTAVVKNTGTEIGTTTVTMKVNDVALETNTVTLAAGASQTYWWTQTKTTVGIYSVNVNGKTATFTVAAPPTPAAFTLSNLSVTPSQPKAGDTVTVKVDVKNTGEQSGSYTTEVKVDGAVKASQAVTVAAGATQTVTLTFAAAGEGSHTVTVGSVSGGFTVPAATPPTPPTPPATDYTWYIVGGLVLVVAVVASYLLMKRKPKA